MQNPPLPMSQSEKPLARAPRIFCVGDEAVLLDSREHVLRKAGYEVRACRSNAITSTFFEPLDAVLLCRSIPADRAAELADKIRASMPSVRLVRLTAFNFSECRHYDGMVETVYGPVRWLADLATFLNRSGVRQKSAGTFMPGSENAC